MKKLMRSVISTILCVCLMLGTTVTGTALPATAAKPAAVNISAQTPVGDTTLGNIFAKVVNFISDFVINGIVLGALRNSVPFSPAIKDYSTFDLDAYGDFYPGHESFLTEPAQGARWNLGYSQKSIIPADFGPRKYARGSMIPYGYTNENLNDLKVRTVAVDDGSGRGITVFAAIDCIGIANADVRKIRAAVEDFAEENNIVSINVSATHTHSGIDSQGVWTDPAGVVINNIFTSVTGIGKLKSGVNSTFLNTLINQTAASIKEACNNMTPGTLTLAKKDMSGYIYDRTAPITFDPFLYRLEFSPDNASVKPTVIATLGVHPEVTSYSFDAISGDLVYYMEEVINRAGSNFIFIQGNVSTTTSFRPLSNDGLPDLNDHEQTVRYGYEFGFITLGLSLSEDECAALNIACGDPLGVELYAGQEHYTVWYEGWEPVEEKEVAPLFNVRMSQFLIKSDNNVSNSICKVSLTNNQFVYDRKTHTYYTISELGYLQIGDGDLQVFLSPGELMGELLMGGSGLYGFKYKSLREQYGENIIVCDLVNDALGYVAADPNYVVIGMQYNEGADKFDSDTWCLLVSLGRNTGSTLFEKFEEIVKSTK